MEALGKNKVRTVLYNKVVFLKDLLN